ncbi:MAG: membrane protein insertase YidC [Gammaproteobacteria bacterium]|nr:membrane protein insertase YidC [Gammaproteobacteria bacterium]
MDNQRLILFIALSFVSLMLWEAWQRDYNSPAPAPTTQQAAAPTATPSAPAADLPTAAPTAKPVQAPADASVTTAARVRVVTDVLDVVIDTQGGDLRQADLTRFPKASEAPDVPVRLLNEQMPDLFIIQSGLRTQSGTEPTHHVVFEAAQKEYRLAPNQDVLDVPLTWRSPEGVTVTKHYRFRPGAYVVELDQVVANQSGKDWSGQQYRQLQRAEGSKDASNKFIYTYTGGVIYSPEDKYEKIQFKDMTDSDLARDIKDGWAAMIQHYFLGALIPAAGEPNHYYSRVIEGNRYVLGLAGPTLTVPTGATQTFGSRIYIGPKLQDQLGAVAPGLELTVDYGKLTLIAKPIFWLVEKIHALVSNWGWSIILLTLIIKLAFYKLSETSYRSMAQMRKMAPRLQALKERYGEDRQKLNQAMMDLYRTEKINPLGGCLPIVIQIPVFIALYWVLLESVEMRQAPFILWLTDLSAKDPYYVLPLIMGVTMFIQQKLNPAPVDPVQAKVMMMLPFIFTVFFAFFPSGLVLYWVTNNILSITQQWVITKRVEQGGK